MVFAPASLPIGGRGADVCTDGFCDGGYVFNSISGALVGFGGQIDSAWAPNSRNYASSDISGTVRIYDAASGDYNGVVVAEAALSNGSIGGLAFTPEGTALTFTDETASRLSPYYTTQLNGCCERIVLDGGVEGFVHEFAPD